MDPKHHTLTLSFILLPMLLGSASCDINQDKAECANQLVGLVPCLPYVGAEAKTPTVDCCSGLKQEVDKSKKCLCVLIKYRDDPSLGLKINTTLAATLPITCRVTVNMTECISLLHLASNSQDAKLFQVYQKLTEEHAHTSAAVVTAFKPAPIPQPQQPNPAPTFYKLALQWPKTVCGTSCRVAAPYRFTIHGLWPHTSIHQEIKAYDATKNRCVSQMPVHNQLILKTWLQNITPRLNVEWPNLHGTNLNFWFHEWLNHGTCSDYYYNATHYFYQAMDLRRVLNSAEFGLIPGKSYSVKDVLNAVSPFIAAKSPQVNCVRVAGSVYLKEIRICYDRPTNLHFGAYINCPNEYSGKCKSDNDLVSLPN